MEILFWTLVIVIFLWLAGWEKVKQAEIKKDVRSGSRSLHTYYKWEWINKRIKMFKEPSS